MSLYESGESTGEVSLEALFDTPENIIGINKLTLDDMAFLICRGGWPRATMQDGDIALDQVKYYYDAVTRADVSRVDGVRRNQERVKRLMRSYARHQGTPAPVSTIVEDMRVNDEESSDVKTITSYIEALKKSSLSRIRLHGILTCAQRPPYVLLTLVICRSIYCSGGTGSWTERFDWRFEYDGTAVRDALCPRSACFCKCA